MIIIVKIYSFKVGMIKIAKKLIKANHILASQKENFGNIINILEDYAI